MNSRRNREGIFSHEAQGYSRPMRSRGEDIYGRSDEFGNEEYNTRSGNPNRTLTYPLSDNESADRRHGYNDRSNFDRYNDDQLEWSNRWPQSRENERNDYHRQGYGRENERFGNSSFRDEEQSQRYGQHRGKGPKGYQRSDERIREDIHDRLTDDHFIDASNIEVNVSNGDVSLTGTVDDRNAKRRAEDISENVGGVRNVENRLRIAGHDAERTGSREMQTGRSAESSNRTRKQDKLPITGMDSN